MLMDTKNAILAFAVLEIIVFWFDWRAVWTARASQGAVGWVAFLITAPYLGEPMYFSWAITNSKAT